MPLAVELDERGAERLRRVARGEEHAFEVVPRARTGTACGPARARTTMRTCDALHPPGRRGLAADPNTRHRTRRRLPPDDAIEDAAGLLRLDEIHVEFTRRVERFADRVRRDLVEHHPLDRHLGVEHLAHVPADRFALAVLVGGEDQLVGVLQRLLQFGDDLLLARVHDVDDVEVVVGVDPGEAAVGLDLVGMRGFSSSLFEGRSRM